MIVGGPLALIAYGAIQGATEDADPRAERQQARDACAALYDDRRLTYGVDEGWADAQDALDYAAGRVADNSDGPDVAAVRAYLDHDEDIERTLAATDNDSGALPEPSIGHDLIVTASQACTNLGQPELQQYLYDETGNEDYAPR